jgi:hypothetical protein
VEDKFQDVELRHQTEEVVISSIFIKDIFVDEI